MPAYVIVMRESPVRDPGAYAEYQRMNRESKDDFSDFKIKPLVIYGAIEAVEGEAPDGVIVLEFPSVEKARAWYNSPAYQAALPNRLKAADFRSFIVEGL